MAQVSFDGVAVKLNGKRQLLLSGAVHYPRSTPALWPQIMRESKAAGLNTIETYVFWNLHEHEKGKLDFTGRLDLPLFLRCCQNEGMNAILRIGPYICAETNFGGLPPWLIHEPGLVTRTDNEPFKHHMFRWCQTLMSRVGEYQATRGGPIILVQLENEYNNVAAAYGGAGKRYMEWVVSLPPKLGIEVPLIMCEGSGQGAIGTLNGFTTAQRVPEFKKQNPDQPALWTENWPAWYDIFGFPHHLRDAQELSFNVMRFFAVGGTGVNYYMWHGGTNFAREAMYLQTTSYDFEGPLDEYGLPTTKSEHLGRLHRALAAHAEQLLNAEPQITVLQPAGEKETLPRAAVYTYAHHGKSLHFAINAAGEPQNISVVGMNLTLAPNSGALVSESEKGAKIVFESQYAKNMKPILRTWKPARVKLDFKQIVDRLPDDVPALAHHAKPLASPVSMLPLTDDMTDYGWYQTKITSRKARTATLTLPMVRDFSTLFVNGKFVGTQPERLDEDRPKHWKHDYQIALKIGANRVTILVAALGLIKGDWMIGAPMSEEKKGLIGDVALDGKTLKLKWTFQSGLCGERFALFHSAWGKLSAWKPVSKAPQRLRWFRAEFGPLNPKALGCALDVGKLYKGFIVLNGQGVGRYWQVPASDMPLGWQAGVVQISGVGAPTQRYYHLPKDWLRKKNTLVIFEETGAAPHGVAIVERK